MNQLVTMTLDGRELCVGVDTVQDVVRLETVTPVPQAPDWIAGVMNLRGHIVTAVDLRARLGLPAGGDGSGRMCVVVDFDGDAYGLIVDKVSEVIAITDDQRDGDPATLPAAWRAISRGVIRLDDALLLEIDPAHIVSLPQSRAA
ncbi:hypothetical protein B5C34_00375 [Pacificimonas flava]|uniref:CheW-like domain-containing protein n=2 Tax=Pacificimonas TaxID=1960290 RepID=A0A219B147_9SPHN|nr:MULTISPECIES: chemotaxis protein CheW [Pacificimonas]MBZ6378334.1 chemotaxis protein CheW [Pacificimonas aurantium]OWV32061.1 hypothetical protein B5C34_00375 [Pacificimonas flava]